MTLPYYGQISEVQYSDGTPALIKHPLGVWIDPDFLGRVLGSEETGIERHWREVEQGVAGPW